MFNNEEKLMLLRVNLYGAMQLLKGDQLEQFWDLIEEIYDQIPDARRARSKGE